MRVNTSDHDPIAFVAYAPTVRLVFSNYNAIQYTYIIYYIYNNTFPSVT